MSGHILYLINKDGLPSEIQSQLVGGDAGEKTYADYFNLNDVYGVTTDLTVYYCSADGNFSGIADSSELDSDDLTKAVLSSTSELGKIINGTDDGTVTGKEAQSITTLTIDGTTDNISSLSELYALTSLKQLTLKNLTLSNLSGIQNATRLYYVYFQNCVISDYSALAKMGSRLQYLYFYCIDDTELTNICAGIQNANFSKLTYLAFTGNMSYVCRMNTTVDASVGSTRSSKTITSLGPVGELSSSVVSNVKYLSIQNNYIADETDGNGNITKYALENLSNFTNLVLLRCEYNNITSLKGLENMYNLKYLVAGYNKLGDNEVYNSTGRRF